MTARRTRQVLLLLVVTMASARVSLPIESQVNISKLAPDARDCRFIAVGTERAPMQQYLRVSLIARDGITEAKLSGKQRKAADIILAEWRERLVLAPPHAFTDTVRSGIRITPSLISNAISGRFKSPMLSIAAPTTLPFGCMSPDASRPYAKSLIIIRAATDFTLGTHSALFAT